MVSTEIPASVGVQGPGEITIFAGSHATIWSTLIASLR
jgi:hypothetical protein